MSLSDPDEHGGGAAEPDAPLEVAPEIDAQQAPPSAEWTPSAYGSTGEEEISDQAPVGASEFSALDPGPVEPVYSSAPAPQIEALVEHSSDSEASPEFSDNWMNRDDAASSGPPPVPPGPVDFSDVVEYANSVELDNSPLVYAFRIEGIDSKDIRKKVLDVLSDIRLNIHVKDLIPTIKGGILELHDLSPIRVSIIASRLREEAVTFRWRQSVFQSEAPEASSGT